MSNPKKHVPIPDDVSMLPVVRAIWEASAAMERVGNRHIEEMGLTPSQFDVLATLGDTSGMTCKALGERALITRGTLTPVLDRLEAKGLVKRCKSEQDNRQTIVALTPEGQTLYEQTFMRHVDFMKPHFEGLAPVEQEQLIALLNKVKAAFA